MYDFLLNSLNIPTIPNQVKNLPFGEVAWSLSHTSRQKLADKLGSKLELLTPEAKRSLDLSLAIRLSFLCAPSIHFQLSLCKIDFTLEGQTPEERYQNFIQDTFFHPNHLLAFFEEHKELARTVQVYNDLWLEQAEEFISRLDEDLRLLASNFNESKPLGKVAQIKMDTGDTHHGGRAVCLLKFESGIEIAYKPKNLMNSFHFNQLQDWINEIGFRPNLKSYLIVPRGGYGWESVVRHSPCLDMEHVTRYFERSGGYLCLMYLLDGTDFHHENIIASGEYPYLIDLETLFSSRIPYAEKELVDDLMQHSVLQTLFLPSYIVRMVGQMGKDISGLGGELNTVRSTFAWENLCTDQINYVVSEIKSVSNPNQVILNNQVVLAKDHIESISLGFGKMYDLIEKNRAKFDEWICLFEQFPVRIILRSTSFYTQLLKRLSTAHSILNQEIYDLEFKLLEAAYNKNKYPNHIIEAEKKALLQGDVPCFQAYPHSTNLYYQDKLISKDCLDYPAAQIVRQRLSKMGKADKAMQETFIRQSFYAKKTPVHNALFQIDIRLDSPLPTESQILAQALQIGNELKNRAFVSQDGSLGWISIEPNLETEQNRLLPVGENLYSGRVGIALFFAGLYEITGDLQWSTAALDCLISVRRAITQKKDLVAKFGIGAMNGVGGIIYALSHIGKLLGDCTLIAEASSLARTIQPSHIEEDIKHDVIFGKAGLILSLLPLNEMAPSIHLEELVRNCGEKLVEAVQTTEAGHRAWPTSNKKLLLGFSHGTSGIAYSLLKLYCHRLESLIFGSARRSPIEAKRSERGSAFPVGKADEEDRLGEVVASQKSNFQADGSINDDELLETIKGAFSYERSLFSEDKRNWPHLGTDSFWCAWCHGASGIGFSRLRSQAFLDDPEFSREVDAAIQTTKNNLDISSLTLCCGLLGHLEFLREASKLDKTLMPFVDRSLKNIFAQINHVKEEFYNPGFMQGQAGLGYTLLRLLDKKNALPQVLMLD